jgi:hypothetical protein
MPRAWENNPNGICEDAPCCGCCGPQGDGVIDIDEPPDFDPYDDDEYEDDDEEDHPICYLGHVDCYDDHTSARLADEADWEQERQEEMERAADDFLENNE